MGPPEHLQHLDRLERLWATSPRHVDVSRSLSKSIANATLFPLRLSFKSSTPASPWKSGNAAPSKPLPRAPGPPLSCGFLVPDVLVSPLPSARVVSEACACVRSQPFGVPVSCLMCGSWLGLSGFGGWRRSWPRWHPWRTWTLTGCSPQPQGAELRSEKEA